MSCKAGMPNKEQKKYPHHFKLTLSMWSFSFPQLCAALNPWNKFSRQIVATVLTDDSFLFTRLCFSVQLMMTDDVSKLKAFSLIAHYQLSHSQAKILLGLSHTVRHVAILLYKSGLILYTTRHCIPEFWLNSKQWAHTLSFCNLCIMNCLIKGPD